MKRIICWLSSHDWEPISIDGPLEVLPDVGPGFPMKADPAGKHAGCRRCRSVSFHHYSVSEEGVTDE